MANPQGDSVVELQTFNDFGTGDGIEEDQAITPPLSKKLAWAYGSGESGLSLAHTIEGFFLTSFLLETAELGPAEVSLNRT